MPERTCSIEGCEKKAVTRGWCAAHYERWRQHGDPGEAGDARKRALYVCAVCGEPARRRSKGDEILCKKHAPKRICLIDGCESLRYCRGWCTKHYNRWLIHGDPERGPLTAEERFWAKVEKTEDCWLWTGGLSTQGYGLISVGLRGEYAHRFSYEVHVGAVPDGKQLDHLCRVRQCVNPAHLEPVTRRENILRGTAPTAINAAKTHCIHGHEYTEENTYRRPDNGGRQCRTCIAIRSRRRSAKGTGWPKT